MRLLISETCYHNTPPLHRSVSSTQFKRLYHLRKDLENNLSSFFLGLLCNNVNDLFCYIGVTFNGRYFTQLPVESQLIIQDNEVNGTWRHRALAHIPGMELTRLQITNGGLKQVKSYPSCFFPIDLCISLTCSLCGPHRHQPYFLRTQLQCIYAKLCSSFAHCSR